ncbi:MAG: Peptidase hyicolysin [Gemmatimonadetes bacterium]|nr:Peptidase hyicolysin [Gemmatimonadota bacterium]
MALPHVRQLMIMGCVACAACGSGEPVGPAGGEFSLGQSLAVESGRDVRILPGAVDGEFMAVVSNVALDSVGRTTFALSGTGLQPVQAGPYGSLGVSADLRPEAPSADAPVRDVAFESRLRDRELAQLTPRMAAARSWYAARVPALPASPSVGDLVSVNVNVDDPCSSPTYHTLRVVALGTKALVLNDTLNPKTGFTTADFQRYAAKFDTLVYPLDVAAFGEPTDIDKNGRIAIVFTRAVNELTPRNSTSYVGGLAYTRDLFPQVASARAQACAASNEGEYFYLMTPDPSGTINGNRRTAGFVDSNTTAVIAHELQHIINASRKLYVITAAPKFEEKWLDEGLAHMAEELLFYRESGLSSRSNLTYDAVASSLRSRNAYSTDMSGNASRYRDFLSSTAKSSPYAAGDSLSTRGATWSLLRYLADQNASSDGDVWSRLVNNTAVGIANLQSVFGRDIGPMVRDWATSLAVDDIAGPAVTQQKSWNWRSVYGGSSGAAALYPLQVTAMQTATSYPGTVSAGGAVYYKLSVPANGTATLSLTGQAGATASNLQLVIVRTK